MPGVKRLAGERRAEFQTCEASLRRRVLACRKQACAQALAGERGRHEEGPDFGRLPARLKFGVVAAVDGIGPKQGAPETPPAAGGEARAVIHDIVGFIRDQPPIHPEDQPKRALDLVSAVVAGLQRPDRGVDQHLDLRDVGRRCAADVEVEQGG